MLAMFTTFRPSDCYTGMESSTCNFNMEPSSIHITICSECVKFHQYSTKKKRCKIVIHQWCVDCSCEWVFVLAGPNPHPMITDCLLYQKHSTQSVNTQEFNIRAMHWGKSISKLCHMLSMADAEKLIHAFVTSRLDYCNALQKLTLVQNAAVRVLTSTKKHDHISPFLSTLY